MNRLVREFSETREGQSKDYIKGKKILEFTLEDVCRKAIKRNLDLRIARLDHKIVEKDTAIKDAAFDPVFDFLLSYTKIDAYERSDLIGRERRKEIDWEKFESDFRKRAEVEDDSELAEGEDSDCVGCEPCIYIDGVLMNPEECGSQYIYSVAREYASITLKHGAIPDAWTGALSASKILSWGQEAKLTVQSANRKNRYPSLG